VKICLVVAAGENGAIGKDNKMPWHLPRDLKYFKSITMGKPIVMGRKTFDSIGRPLPGRQNIVITRQLNWQHADVNVVHDLPSALEIGKNSVADGDEGSELMIIGGAEIYAQALASADKIYLTRVDVEPEADAFFPSLESSDWLEVKREEHQPCDKNPYGYAFCVLERVTSGDS